MGAMITMVFLNNIKLGISCKSPPDDLNNDTMVTKKCLWISR